MSAAPQERPKRWTGIGVSDLALLCATGAQWPLLHTSSCNAAGCVSRVRRFIYVPHTEAPGENNPSFDRQPQLPRYILGW